MGMGGENSKNQSSNISIKESWKSCIAILYEKGPLAPHNKITDYQNDTELKHACGFYGNTV